MTTLTYNKAKEWLSDVNLRLDFEDSFKLARFCSELISRTDTEEQGRDLIIRVLDVWNKVDKKTVTIWNNLVETTGLQPYVDEKMLTGSSCIRHEFSKSNILKDYYLHEEQMQLSLMLQSSQSVILSAPTSFGKSLLIEEIVASKKYHNLVIIQPTLALLDETRKKLLAYSNLYNIVVSTLQKPKDSNIFLFTGERVAEYRDFPKIDFFVIDEFYKLSMDRDDERAPILNQALYSLLQMTDKFYMLGPGVRRVSEDFLKKYNVAWCRTDFATVAVDIKGVEVSRTVDGKKDSKGALFDLLKDLKEPTLIYCSSPNLCVELIEGFLEYLSKKKNISAELNTAKNQHLIEWIDENVHSDWVLKSGLEYSIGFHNGSLIGLLIQQYIILLSNLIRLLFRIPTTYV